MSNEKISSQKDWMQAQYTMAIKKMKK